MSESDNNTTRRDFSGIPRGNTVAIVGDPGTGKTTFLLSYVAHGEVASLYAESAADTHERGLVRLDDQGKSEDAYSEINQLFDVALKDKVGKKQSTGGEVVQTDDKKQKQPMGGGTLRCFISLENNLSRVLDNHGALLSKFQHKANDTEKSISNDQFVAIDATAFLSGRLEDRLRYPRLSGSRGPQQMRDWFGKDNVHDLNLGGYHLDNDEKFGLYYQPKGKDPRRIEQIEREKKPFQLANDDADDDKVTTRAFNLITQPIPDPFQRVRLIKDLLAEIFARFDERCTHKIVAIDSLSALMNTFDDDHKSSDAAPERRLHMLNLIRWLEENGVTTFLACEADHDSSRTWGGHRLFLGTQERYLASGVIQLNYHAYPSGDIVRYLRVLKMRGAAHDMRPHAYDLDSAGIAWVEPLFGEAGMVR